MIALLAGLALAGPVATPPTLPIHRPPTTAQIRAHDARAKAKLRVADERVEACYRLTHSYPSCTTKSVAGLPGGVVVSGQSADPLPADGEILRGRYSVSLTSNSMTVFEIAHYGGRTVYSCTEEYRGRHGRGGCVGGRWVFRR